MLKNDGLVADSSNVSNPLPRTVSGSVLSNFDERRCPETSGRVSTVSPAGLASAAVASSARPTKLAPMASERAPGGAKLKSSDGRPASGSGSCATSGGAAAAHAADRKRATHESRDMGAPGRRRKGRTPSLRYFDSSETSVSRAFWAMADCG